MRVAPVACSPFMPEIGKELAAETSALTHGQERRRTAASAWDDDSSRLVLNGTSFVMQP